MTADNGIVVTHRGKSFQLSKTGLRNALTGVMPERVGKYGVDINGKEYPIRQVIAKATNTPKIEWTTTHAYSLLQKLGLKINTHE